MTRRLSVLAAAALAASLALAAPEKAGQADRIFVGGRVWTGESGGSVWPSPPTSGPREPTARPAGATGSSTSRWCARPTCCASRRPASSQDLLAIPPERIKSTRALLTVLGGQDTWRAKEF